MLLVEALIVGLVVPVVLRVDLVVEATVVDVLLELLFPPQPVIRTVVVTATAAVITIKAIFLI